MGQHVAFPVGDLSLEGLLLATSTDSAAVVCHPHPLRGGDMHNNVVNALVGGLQAAGFATLRFNFRGVGGSTGMHDDGNSERDDVRAAVGFLLDQVDCGQVALVGYSFGAFVALQAGAADHRVHTMVGVGLPVAARDPSLLRDIAKPTLLISGDRDDFSPISVLLESVGPLSDDLSVVPAPGADHFFFGAENTLTKPVIDFLRATSNRSTT